MLVSATLSEEVEQLKAISETKFSQFMEDQG